MSFYWFSYFVFIFSVVFDPSNMTSAGVDFHLTEEQSNRYNAILHLAGNVECVYLHRFSISDIQQNYMVIPLILYIFLFCFYLSFLYMFLLLYLSVFCFFVEDSKDHIWNSEFRTFWWHFSVFTWWDDNSIWVCYMCWRKNKIHIWLGLFCYIKQLSSWTACIDHF